MDFTREDKLPKPSSPLCVLLASLAACGVFERQTIPNHTAWREVEATGGFPELIAKSYTCAERIFDSSGLWV